jgi:hypothetical protein
VILNAACVGILEVTALTRSEAIKTGVTVGTQLAGELPRIQCDRVQLQQVTLNLIVLRTATANYTSAPCVSSRRAYASRRPSARPTRQNRQKLRPVPTPEL